MITVLKPWGRYEILEKKTRYWIKKLYIDRGKSLSLQSHKNRVENWLVLFGEINVIKNNRQHSLKEGEYFKIDKNVKHRISAIAQSCILEVAFGQVLENDIIRYQDDYGRK